MFRMHGIWQMKFIRLSAVIVRLRVSNSFDADTPAKRKTADNAVRLLTIFVNHAKPSKIQDSRIKIRVVASER